MRLKTIAVTMKRRNTARIIASKPKNDEVRADILQRQRSEVLVPTIEISLRHSNTVYSSTVDFS
jgi:hypothetical protein